MRKLLKALSLFGIGGGIYYLIEIAWRGHSHPAMIVVGGLCFVLIGGINEWFTWDMALVLQGAIATVNILIVELGAGIVLNRWLGLGIWDYSHLPGNILGQICLPFAAAWYALSIAGIILDDWLRYWLFHEERPHYRIV
jgi:hypothetical protein